MDKYDIDIAFLTENPQFIPYCWNMNCNLFAQRKSFVGGYGCPSQIKFGSESVTPDWNLFIDTLNIPPVETLAYPLSSYEEAILVDNFPIKIHHLEQFAIAQRKADELGLQFAFNGDRPAAKIIYEEQ